MDTFKGLDIIDYAIAEDTDFVAFVVSPWHMIGVQAVLERLKVAYKELHGIIAVCRNGNGNYTINPEAYSNMYGVEFVYYDSEIQKDIRVWNAIDLRVNKGVSEKNRKYFLIPNRLDVFLYAYYVKKLKGQLLECYILDEGLGTYVGLNGSDTDKNRRHRVSFVEKVITKIVERYTDKLIHYNRWNNFSILKLNNNNEWINNETSIRYYSQAITKTSVQEDEVSHMYSGAIVINTQPFMGVGIPEGNVDIDILLALCKKCKKSGLKIVIKPHPGQKDLERYGKLNEYVFFDLRKGLSQEEILNSLKDKPKAVVAFSSTTLLTTKLFFGIPSYSLASILMQKDINEYHRERLKAFVDTFEKQIDIYDSVDKVVEKIVTEI